MGVSVKTSNKPRWVVILDGSRVQLRARYRIDPSPFLTLTISDLFFQSMLAERLSLNITSAMAATLSGSLLLLFGSIGAVDHSHSKCPLFNDCVQAFRDGTV